MDGDRDVRINLTREEFENEMSRNNIPNKLKTCLNEAMKLAQIATLNQNKVLDRLHSVELLGGCSYIPSLRNMVDVTMSGLFKPIRSGVRQTMDPLDSVSRGCSLSAASLLSYSPHLKRYDTLSYIPFQN